MNDTTDTRSHGPDQIANAARWLGKSVRKQAIFEFVNKGKSVNYTLTQIAEGTGLDRSKVSEFASQLASHHLIAPAGKRGREPLYKQVAFFRMNREIVLRLARQGMADAAGKAQKQINVTIKTSKSVTAYYFGCDELKCFKGITLHAGVSDPSTLTEQQFKDGVASLLQESGTFKDWGGEKNDLYTCRLAFRGRTVRAAFAFKGRGLSVAVANPKHFGRNGDQISRLFDSNAEVYVLQYWRGVSEQVHNAMEAYAQRRANAARKDIYFSVMDGTITSQLMDAYPDSFKSP